MNRKIKLASLSLFMQTLILVMVVPAAHAETPAQQSIKQPLEITTQTEDINITYDKNIAREQVVKFPDSPEAHFVLAVNLTRSSQIEEAFKEIRISRRLAQKLGGPEYFSAMIEEYEKILEHAPEDNRIRYHLAWAYYMKAYLLAEYSKRVAASSETEQTNSKTKDNLPRTKEWHKEWVAATIEEKTVQAEENEEEDTTTSESASTPPVGNSQKDASGQPVRQLTAMEQVIKKAAPSAVPHIKKYYQSALKQLDQLLSRAPEDVWSRLYKAHLSAEYTGDLDSAMTTWKKIQEENPNNPAAYFFLGEGYLKKGNLRECLTNVSKAVALRAIGN